MHESPFRDGGAIKETVLQRYLAVIRNAGGTLNETADRLESRGNHNRAFKHRRVRDCEPGFQGGEVNK